MISYPYTGYFSRHSTIYVQCLCPFFSNFFSGMIFSCQVSSKTSFTEIPRSYGVPGTGTVLCTWGKARTAKQGNTKRYQRIFFADTFLPVTNPYFPATQICTLSRKSRSINQSFPQAASKLRATCFLSVSTQ